VGKAGCDFADATLRHVAAGVNGANATPSDIFVTWRKCLIFKGLEAGPFCSAALTIRC
jgi:hypothetical protein